MEGLAAKIEHTILKADATESEIKKLCEEAKEHRFFGVCVPPYFIKLAKQVLSKTECKVVSVVGFPLGYNSTPSKVEETRKAIDEGADEIDMVLNIAAFKNGDFNFVLNDIQSVCTLTHLKNRKLKVIIETALLSKEEIVKACEICAEAGVDFVKTSTGFSTSGAQAEDISLMRNNLPSNIGIKASGGIKNKEQALALVEAGASRIGASAGVKLL
ncbi:MAG: deoxyribose-phosphate aldolase [Chitinophagales bacterium]|nr:deoxyribose-phosphate aldolase [Chitinophagales bacterium]